MTGFYKGGFHQVFASCLRQALLSARGIAAMSIIVALIAASGADKILEAVREGWTMPYGYPIQYVIDGLDSDAMMFFLPLVCALPYASGYVEDLKSGMVKLILPRTTRRSYLLGKIIACMVSGGLVVVTGIAIAVLLALPFLHPLEEAAAAEGGLAASEVMTMRIHELTVSLMSKAVLFFMSGMLWSGFGMLASSMSENGYVAFISPFILYYLLVIICERYFTDMRVFYPKEWLSPGEWWPFGNTGVALWVSELMLIFTVLFMIKGENRLNRL